MFPQTTFLKRLRVLAWASCLCSSYYVPPPSLTSVSLHPATAKVPSMVWAFVFTARPADPWRSGGVLTGQSLIRGIVNNQLCCVSAWIGGLCVRERVYIHVYLCVSICLSVSMCLRVTKPPRTPLNHEKAGRGVGFHLDILQYGRCIYAWLSERISARSHPPPSSVAICTHAVDTARSFQLEIRQAAEISPLALVVGKSQRRESS
jgi:hypothetical protein